MKVRMNDTVATTAGSYDRGHVYDVDDTWGEKAVANGVAVALDDQGNPKESSVAKSAETRKEAEKAAADPADPTRHRQTLDRRVGLPVETVNANLAAGKTASGSHRSPSDPDTHAPATPVLSAAVNANNGPGLTTQNVLGAPASPSPEATGGNQDQPAPAPVAPIPAQAGSISAPQPSQTPRETTAEASKGRGGKDRR